MTVHFIGAGPGAADLITLRGARLLAACPVCLYAGSIVPPEMLSALPARRAPRRHRAADPSTRSRPSIVAADAAGQDVARLHSGDLSLYSAVAEQLRRLRRLGIAYTLTPGVPAFAAAAAALGRELTVPGLAQTVVLTRTARPRLRHAAARDAGGLRRHRGDAGDPSVGPRCSTARSAPLMPHYGADCPAAAGRARKLARRAADPRDARRRCWRHRAGVERTALLLVGPALAAEDFAESALYSPDYPRRFRLTPGFIVAAPRSGAGKTTVTLGLIAAFAPPRRGGAHRQVRPRLHRPRVPRRRIRPAGHQPRQLGHAARPARHARSRTQAARPGWRALLVRSRKRHGPVRRRRRPARPRRRRRRPRRAVRAAGAAGARRLRPGAVGRRRRARLRDCTTRRCHRRRGAQPGRQRAPPRGAAAAMARHRPAGARRHAARRRARPARTPSRPGAGRRARRRCAAHARPARRRRRAASRPRRHPRRRSPLRPLRRADARRPHRRRPASASRSRADAAFSFIYPHLLAGWRAAGAEILPFSPLADEPPPDDCDACWLPGGYPELHAARSPPPRDFRDGLRALRRDAPGARRVRRLHGARRRPRSTPTAVATPWPACSATPPASPSAGCISATASASSCADTARAPAGVRGHEFHYATLTDPGADAPLATLRDAAGATSARPAAGAAPSPAASSTSSPPRSPHDHSPASRPCALCRDLPRRRRGSGRGGRGPAGAR